MLNHRPALDPDPDALAAFAAASDIVIGSRDDARAIVSDDRPDAVAERLGPNRRELALSDGGRPAAVVTDAGVALRGAADDRPQRRRRRRRARRRVPRRAPPRRAAPSGRSPGGVAALNLSIAGDGCAASYPGADATAALAVQLLRASPSAATR